MERKNALANDEENFTVCQRGVERQIDEISKQIWELSGEELKEIRSSLEELKA